MKNNSSGLPKFAIMFANTAFVVGLVFSVFVVILYVYRLAYPAGGPYPDHMMASVYKYYFKMILVGGIFATLFGLVLRINNKIKVSLSVSLVTAGIAVYGFETYEVFRIQDSQRAIAARQMGVPYDTRTKVQVIKDLNDSGIKAYPNPGAILHKRSNGLNATDGWIQSFGGISNITTIFVQNESGHYPIVETDEHGFINPKGLYKENNVDVVLTGDSFAEGYSVRSNETVSAVLRNSGFKVINLGRGGNGPFRELAVVKEYAEPLKPTIVLWLYFTNDFDDLRTEMESPGYTLFFRKYLNENGFSQHLMSRQKEIDSVLISYIQNEMAKEKERERAKIINLFQLTNFRSRINLTLAPTPAPTPAPAARPIFKRILQTSKQIVSRWGGKLYFVYLPEYGRYSTGLEDINREFVMRTATELEIPIIDIHREVFDPHPDPLHLFPFRLRGHYNAEGYRLVAEAIGNKLEADGFIPTNSAQ